MSTQDRIEGVIYGTAIGDSLGYQTEFNKSIQPVQGLSPRGEYSDDTQMMLATLDGLLAAGKGASLEVAAVKVAIEYVRWSVSPENNRAPGGACMSGCRNLQTMGVSRWRETGGPDSKGCGTAMRSMAYALWFPGDPELAAIWAGEHAVMTHNTLEAQGAAAAVAAGVCAAMDGASKLEVACTMMRAAASYDEPLAELLLEAARLAAFPLATRYVTTQGVLDKWRGWRANEAVAASLYCYLVGADFPDTVLTAVNSPGDSDTLGCISGALAGATYGAAAIPQVWKDGIENAGLLKVYANSVMNNLDTKAFADQNPEL